MRDKKQTCWDHAFEIHVQEPRQGRSLVVALWDTDHTLPLDAHPRVTAPLWRTGLEETQRMGQYICRYVAESGSQCKHTENVRAKHRGCT